MTQKFQCKIYQVHVPVRIESNLHSDGRFYGHEAWAPLLFSLSISSGKASMGNEPLWRLLTIKVLIHQRSNWLLRSSDYDIVQSVVIPLPISEFLSTKDNQGQLRLEGTHKRLSPAFKISFLIPLPIISLQFASVFLTHGIIPIKLP